jgi:hypothetical protein
MKGDFKGEIRKIGESIGNSIIAVKPVLTLLVIYKHVRTR